MHTMVYIFIVKLFQKDVLPTVEIGRICSIKLLIDDLNHVKHGFARKYSKSRSIMTGFVSTLAGTIYRISQ